MHVNSGKDRGMLHSLLRRTVVGTVATAVLALAPTALAAPKWYDGNIAWSTITNCVSIIQGNPYSEYGAGSYSGFYADPNALPHIGDTYYTHVVVSGVGNSCAGQYADI